MLYSAEELNAATRKVEVALVALTIKCGDLCKAKSVITPCAIWNELKAYERAAFEYGRMTGRLEIAQKLF